jgi:hypothetical protein
VCDPVHRLPRSRECVALDHSADLIVDETVRSGLGGAAQAAQSIGGARRQARLGESVRRLLDQVSHVCVLHDRGADPVRQGFLDVRMRCEGGHGLDIAIRIRDLAPRPDSKDGEGRKHTAEHDEHAGDDCSPPHW